MNIKLIYSLMKADIDLIEKELESAVKSISPVLEEASVHLLQAGGKRIRPVLLLLGAKFGEYDIHRVKFAAAALELIHMASLVHDDVIDDAVIRRGQHTVKAEWDNRIAMYTGDFIFAAALECMTKVEDREAHRILSHTMTELCIGEIVQIQDKYRFEQNLRDYLRRIKRKTAILIAASCQLGAIAAGAPAQIHQKLYEFGYNVGMSFQITDDILDFTASEKDLGKPAGGDLLQGNITLPVLYAMENEDLKERITAVHAHTDRQDINQIIHLLKQSDAIERSHELSRRYLDRALAIMEELPPGRHRNSLRDIAYFIGRRKY
ncbi:heptaprenyl diphosphate synthase component II [Domibacillus epiphyticus]|uniref:Heptaprenyl diphosphate synthase component 2 n=1 Tax=Domibacillus epiphyticus TaxID=1714355 RepID=A0A1V2A4D8_9BACI|nr:heptaprenyl diphosphate synthase component II [Domibacillus epiphyticus]OMP65865.1 heptaprenyl diphosphate synthase component II [Domibacillus epiphyticus]